MTERKTTAAIVDECAYVLDLERKWRRACEEQTPEGDVLAEQLQGQILAWWDALALSVEEKVEAALYVLAEAEGRAKGARETKKALVAPLDARIKRADATVQRIKEYVLPSLIAVERERVGELDVAIETPLGKVRMQKASNPALVGPRTEDGEDDLSRWPDDFLESKPLRSLAARFYRRNPERMEQDGFSWDESESVRVYR